MCLCVVIPFILDVRLVDVPAIIIARPDKLGTDPMAYGGFK